MTSPRWIDVHAPAVELKALTWGPPDGPIALCLHGFPDTAYGWRNFAPRLAESGWRVVAPFMRGYAPSSIPSDGSYHLGALMDDALQVRSAAGGTDRDVVIGHDWGAMAANGLAAMPDSPFAKAVIMSVPPAAAFRPLSRVPDRAGCWLRSRLSYCAAGTSCTSNCLGCQSDPHPGCCRGCGGDGHRATTPKKICAMSTPRSGHRRAGVPRSGPTVPPFAIPARRCATPNCTGTGHRHRRCRASTYTAATTVA